MTKVRMKAGLKAGKADVIDAVIGSLAVAGQADRGITKGDVAVVVDHFLAALALAAVTETTITLKAFGVFAPKVRAARAGRNPGTGAAVAIPARTVLTFRPAKGLTATQEG